jgi:CTP synthase
VYGGAAEIGERHRHRYEFNPEFREMLSRAGMVFSGESPDGKFVEMVELPREAHPWFLGCQFHPEYKSKPLKAHPLFTAFVRAASVNRQRNEAATGGSLAPETTNAERMGVAGDD